MSQSQQSARLRPFRPVPFGRYTLLSPLATGGMGEIFLARLDGLQGVEKLCVIKKILPHLSSDKDFVERFVNEAKILVKLSHGSIAQVLDVGLSDGDPYIALEYVDGKDLRKIAARARDNGVPLPLTFVLFVMGRVLDALAYAHRKKDDDDKELGLVHRDVSPQNVLISYEGEVKVIDFGLAKSTLNVSKTHPSIILGKFLYMSPEQAKHQGVDRRSDLYAVGLCLYELITGKNPFDDVPPGELMARVATPSILPIGQVDPLCPGPVQALLGRALQVDPAQRFQSAEEFRGKLLACLLEIDSTAGPESVTRYMRETFATEYQAERKLLAGLREANRVASRAGPPPRKEINEADTAVVNLSSIAATTRMSSGPTLPALSLTEVGPAALSFAPTPRAKEDSAERKPEGETSPGIAVDSETHPAIVLPDSARDVASRELEWRGPKRAKGPATPFDEPPTDAAQVLVTPLPHPLGGAGAVDTQPRVVLGQLLESPPTLVPASPRGKRDMAAGQDRVNTQEVKTTDSPAPSNLRRWILPGAVLVTLAAVASAAYFVLPEVMKNLGSRPEAPPAPGAVAEVQPNGMKTPLTVQQSSRIPVPANEDDPAASLGLTPATSPQFLPNPGAPKSSAPDNDLLPSSLAAAGPKAPAAAAHKPPPKRPPKMDRFHVEWQQTQFAWAALVKKHPCEEPSMAILCTKWDDLKGKVDQAGDEAGTQPALKQKMENMRAEIRDKAARP